MRNFLLISILFSSTTFAADHTISTSGKCVVDVAPDRASVVFTIENVNRDVKIAIEKTTALHEKLKAELQKTNAKDLELSTSEYTVYEKTEYRKKKLVSLGYAARIGLKVVSSDISAVNKMMGIAASFGVNDTGNFVSYLSDQKQLTEKKRCLETAVLNAKEKAEAMAKPLDAKIGKPIAISEGTEASFHSMNEVPAPMMAGKPEGGRAYEPSLQGHSQTVQQEVQVTFLLE